MSTPLFLTRTKRTQLSVALFGSVAAMCAGLLIIAATFVSPTHETTQTATVLTSVKPVQLPPVVLEAKAAYVFDVTSHTVLYDKNADTQLPLASLAKVMLALATADTVPPDTRIVITAPSIAQDGDSGLHVGETWSLHDLMNLTLVMSSNDGADAIARGSKAFIKPTQLFQDDDTWPMVWKMNDEARALGLTKTYFVNPTGLDISTSVSGAYGSARDYAQLLSYVIVHDPSLLSATAKDGLLISSETSTHKVENTNHVLDTIPGLIAGKTGYTDLAGGNLAIAFDLGLNHPIIAVVLGSSYDGRFTDMQKLVDATRAAYESVP